MKSIYIITNKDRGTNWNVGAFVKQVTSWSGGYAGFTDAKNPQVMIHAHQSEVSLA